MSCVLLCTAAAAQDYPSKPLRLIVGFPPGGSNDLVARQLAPKLTGRLGPAAQVIVENRPGDNAMIGIEHVAKSALDGYTLGLGGVSPLVLTNFTSASPEAYTAFIKQEFARWAKVAKAANMKAQ